jgi:hypothetical protein
MVVVKDNSDSETHTASLSRGRVKILGWAHAFAVHHPSMHPGGCQ